MKIGNIKQYLSLRSRLISEKATLEARLGEIKRALSAEPAAPAAPAAAVPRRGRRGRRRAKNAFSMKEASLKVLAAKPLSRQDTLKAIQKLGYKFTAKDPLNSLSALLYSDKAFKNEGGKFRPA